MKINSKAINILVLSLFFKSFIIQYFALFIVYLMQFISKKIIVYKNIFLHITIYILFVSFLSYAYNIFYNNTDGLSMFFWILSYLPPFILIQLSIYYSNKIDFFKIYKFYKYIVIFETILLIITAIKMGKYIVSDAGVGTVGDANFIAYHIAIVILYEISFILSYKLSLKEKLKKIAEILYFLIIMPIPEATATTGFLMISLVFLFIFIFAKQINIIKVITILIFSIIGLCLFSQTMVYDRISNGFNQLKNISIDSNNLYLSKFNMYYYLFSGKIYSEVNLLLGSGPATFTSRSSVVRMPDIRINKPPIDVPTFYSKTYKKFVYDNELALKNVSLGNFATPKTSFISIAVELGVLGIVGFIIFFIMIIYKSQKNNYKFKHLKPFVFSLTIFYIMHFMFLNTWEYPIYTFTFIIITFIILYNKKIKEKHCQNQY